MGTGRSTSATTTAQAPSFNTATRQSILQYYDFGPVTSPGVPAQFQLPQVGLLANLYFQVQANVTVPSTGTPVTNVASPIPDPFRFIQRVRVFTNEGNEIFNVTGAGLYLIQRTLRSTYDPRNPAVSLASSNTAAAIYSMPASPANNGTYQINFGFKIPLSWGAQLQAGLIMLQNPQTRVTLELTLGNPATDLISGVTSVVNSLSVPVQGEIYAVPANRQSYPDLSMVMTTQEQLSPINNVGQFQYFPLLGNTYIDWIMQFENNMGGSNADYARMVPASFSQLQLIYSQTQQVYSYSPSIMLMRIREMLGGIDLPDGVFWWGLGDGFGLPEVGSPRDAIDTSQLTDLRLITTLQNVTLSSAQVRVIARQLCKTAGG